MAKKRKAAAKKAVAKASKKAPAKAKKQVYVKIKSNILGEAPQEFEFYLSDGRRLKSIYELVDALETMPDELFGQYVNETKNDFSNWIKGVFKEHNVAKEIQQVKSRIETQKLLIKRLIEAAKSASK